MTSTTENRATDALTQSRDTFSGGDLTTNLTEGDQRNVAAVWGHTPAVAVIGHQAPTIFRDVLSNWAYTSDYLSRTMHRAEAAETALRDLQNDVAAMRRVLGLTTAVEA